MKNIFIAGFLLICLTSGYAQEFNMRLWTETVPNTLQTEETEILEQKDILYIRNVQDPEIAVFLPAARHATGDAVVICPGGGYRVLAYDWEGVDIASWFNSKGVAAIVLKYRLPVSNSILISHEAPLQDAQRAMSMVRYYADEWNINKNRIGIMGFSAGGHLASTLGTKFDHRTFEPGDEIDRTSARPDFMILVYPVISFREKFSHNGSRNALLGNDATQELIDFYSNELHVGSDTPPAFIVHSGDDKGVPVENSLYFYQALKDQGISSEMHIYPYGGHGFSLAIGRGYLQSWTERLNDWLKNSRESK